jgi:hypothetical protein
VQSISGSIEGSVPQNATVWQACSPLFEIALMLVRLDYVARAIVNADHSIGFRLVSIRRLVDVICLCDRRIGQSRFVRNRFQAFPFGPNVNETFPIAAAISVPLPDDPPVGVEPSPV